MFVSPKDPPTSVPVFRAILLTDIAGHSDIRNRVGEERFREVKRRHDEIIRQTVRTHEGRMENDTGDGWVLSFSTPSAAVRAALEIQQRLRLEPEDPVRLGVRMGIDMGEISYSRLEPAPGETEPRTLISGVSIGNATMTMNLAEAGQILVTQPVFEQARRSVTVHPPCPTGAAAPELRWQNHGFFHLKGGVRAVIHEIGAVGFAPFRTPLGGARAEGQPVSGAPGWVLLRPLGSWEHGDVWLARNVTRESQVFRFADTEEGKQGLLRQLDVRKLLNERLETAPPAYRRACLPILDSNFQTWPAFLRVAYMPDGNLRQALSPGGAFASASPDERIDFVRRVADILDQVLSQARVAHCCLEPSKILLDRNETGALRPCLFGFRRDLADDDQTTSSDGRRQAHPSAAFRDKRFCPPEAMRGAGPAPDWDVYSLGVILYQVATGRLEQLPTAAEKHLQDPLLREEIFACLDDDPKARPTARQLAQRLQSLPHRREAANYKRRVQRSVLGLSVLAAVSLSVLWIAWRERERSAEIAEARWLSEVARADTLFRQEGDRITVNRILEAVPVQLRSPDWYAHRKRIPSVRELLQPERVEFHPHVGGRRWTFLPDSQAEELHQQVYLTETGFRTYGSDAGGGEVPTPFRGDACCYDAVRRILWIAGEVQAEDTIRPALAAFSGGPPWHPIQLTVPDLPSGYPRILEVSPDGGTLLGLWVADGTGSLETFRITRGERDTAIILKRPFPPAHLPQPFYPSVDVHWSEDRDFAALLDSRDGALAVRLLNLRSGEEWAQDSELTRFPVKSRKFRALQISPDGEELLLAQLESPVSRWQTASGARIGDVFPLLPIVQPGAAQTPGTDAAISRAAYHPAFPHTPLIAVARYEPDHRIEVWSITSRGGQLEWAESVHRSIIGHLRFSPSGQLLVSGSVDGFYRIWNSEDGTPVVEGMLPGKLSIQEPEFFADDALVSFSGQGYLQRWSFPSTRLRALAYSVNLKSGGAKSSMYGAAFSADSSELFIGLQTVEAPDEVARSEWRGRVARYNLRTLQPAGELSGGHDPIRACTLSADGSVLLSSSDDYRSTIWTRDEDGSGFTAVDTLTRDPVDQRGGQDLRIARFFLAEEAGKLIKIYTPFPDNRILPDFPPGAAIFDLPEGDAPLSQRLRWDRLKLPSQDLPGFSAQLELNASVDPAGNWLATAFHLVPDQEDAGSALALTSLRTGITWFIPGFSQGANLDGNLNPSLAPRWDFSEISFSADGRRVLAASNRLHLNPDLSRFAVYLCKLDEMQERWPAGGTTDSADTWARRFEPGVRTSHVELGSLGGLALTAAEDGTVRVWDATEGSATTSPLMILNPQRGEEKVVKARFVPGREDLVATLSEVLRPGKDEASRLPSCRIWALPPTSPSLRPLVLRHEIIRIPLPSISNADLKFSPDGRWLLLCGWEDHFRLVRVPKPAAAQAAFQVVGALTASGDAEPKSSSQAAWESRLSGDRLSLPLKDPSVAMPDQKILFQSPVRRIDESPDKNFLLIVTEDGRASLWNPRYGVETVVLAEKGCIAARFDPDSRRIQLLRRQPLKLLSAFNPAPFGFVERWELLETSLSPDNIQSRAITSPSSQ